METCDVIIVGAGPAGIFAALELVRQDELKVIILDKGPDLERRTCPAREGACINCKPCAITSGWGGAGAFSDGKLTLTPDVGGWLSDYIGTDRLTDLIAYVDRLYMEFGAPGYVFGTDESSVRDIAKKAARIDLTLVPMRVKHLGTDRCREVLGKIRKYLEDKVEIRVKTRVESILATNGVVQGVVTTDGEVIHAEHVIVAPGREGAEWLSTQAKALGINTKTNEVDIGVRVETKAATTDPITRSLYEPKLIYKSRTFQDKVRTFCVNPNGQVSAEMHGDIMTVNGHSYADSRTDNTNFALLVSTMFTEPFKEPIAYGRHIAHLANLLGEGILVQRLGDLRAGRRSTKKSIAKGKVKPTLVGAAPGDISFALPYRHLIDILEMIQALDGLAPGLNSEDTLLYGVEVKFYSFRLDLSSRLETEVENLFAIGDGAGITRGLVQSSCSGVVAARSVLEKALVL